MIVENLHRACVFIIKKFLHNAKEREAQQAKRKNNYHGGKGYIYAQQGKETNLKRIV